MEQPADIVRIKKPQGPRYRVYTRGKLDRISQLMGLPAELRHAIEVAACVFPFRVNNFVLDELIDWNQAPHDPMFRLTFPQREMLSPADFALISNLLRRNASPEKLQEAVWSIRRTLNPHPAGQMEMNVPQLEGESLPGMQHKYRETVLYFPARGQVCHSYCTFCFRWAQFVGDEDLTFASKSPDGLARYLAAHQEVTDLLITGGDPMVMKAHHLEECLAPLFQSELAHVQTVRIGTKSLTFWPHRYLTDPDADDLLRVFERLIRAGKHVSVMAHFNHPRELRPAPTQAAIRRLRDAGVAIRSQSPVLRHINDDAENWADLWREQVRLGIEPYYMFVERDTGARAYFEVPLARSWEIYRNALKQVSGLGRTARGPSMSTMPGKVEIQGVTEVRGERIFVLRFIQARNPDWVQRPFFAHFDENATWLDDLRPAFGEEQFFF